MNHNGAVFLVVLADILKFKAFRQVVIHLDSTELPAATDSVFHHKVEFRAVECSLAVFYFGGQTFFFTGLNDGALGFLPNLVRAYIFLAVVRVAK